MALKFRHAWDEFLNYRACKEACFCKVACFLLQAITMFLHSCAVLDLIDSPSCMEACRELAHYVSENIEAFNRTQSLANVAFALTVLDILDPDLFRQVWLTCTFPIFSADIIWWWWATASWSLQKLLLRIMATDIFPYERCTETTPVCHSACHTVQMDEAYRVFLFKWNLEKTVLLTEIHIDSKFCASETLLLIEIDLDSKLCATKIMRART